MTHKKHINFKLAVSATLMGNTLEWYDYQTYGLFVPIFIHIFFVEADPVLAVLESLSAYAIGQIARPLGGILFGTIADRFGRRMALLCSILLMTGPVFVITILPTHMQIGIAAPIIFVIMRAFQGIAAGGELPVVATYLVECTPQKNRGLFGSFVFFGVFFGLFLGMIEYSYIHNKIPLDKIYEWGWRIPFAFGVLIGCATYFLRRKLSETPLFQEIVSHEENIKHPILRVFQKNKKNVGILIGLACMQTVGFNILLICMTTHLTLYLKMPLSTAIMLNLMLLVFLQLFLPIMGKAGDRFGHRRVAQISAYGFLIFSYPLFLLFHEWGHIGQVASIFGFAVMIAGYHASVPILFCDLFPTPIRASGVGISYNLAAGFIGGLTPVTVFYLTSRFNWPNLGAFFLIAAAIISLIVLANIKKHHLYLTKEV